MVVNQGVRPNSDTKKLIRDIVLEREEVWLLYLPEILLSLEDDLGADEYPRMAVGKMQEIQVKQLVQICLADKEERQRWPQVDIRFQWMSGNSQQTKSKPSGLGLGLCVYRTTYSVNTSPIQLKEPCKP